MIGDTTAGFTRDNIFTKSLTDMNVDQSVVTKANEIYKTFSNKNGNVTFLAQDLFKVLSKLILPALTGVQIDK